MSARVSALATFAVLGLAGAAHAQTDATAMAHAAAANQLGDIGTDAVTAQRSAMAHLPASATPNDADEALGKKGTLDAPNGNKMTPDSIASSHGMTVSAMCKQMGSSAVQSAAMFKQSGMTPGGMAMPKMPAMPNGMSMPGMPSVPNQQ